MPNTVAPPSRNNRSRRPSTSAHRPGYDHRRFSPWPQGPAEQLALFAVGGIVVSRLAVVAGEHKATLAWAGGVAVAIMALLVAVWVARSGRTGTPANPYIPIAVAAAAGTVAGTALTAAGGDTKTAWMIGVAGTALTMLAAATAVRSGRKRGISRRLVAYLAPVVGVRSPEQLVGLVTVRRWRGVWRPRPHVGAIHPPPGVEEASPDLHAAIRRVFDQRLALHVVLRPDPRVDRLHFTVTPPPEQQPEDPHLTRLRTVIDSLGKALPDATVAIQAWAADDPKATRSAVEVFPVTAFRVRHAPTPQLGNPGVRAVISAELGQMLYGDPNCLQAIWRRHADEVIFRVRPELPTVIPNPALEPATLTQRYNGQLVLPLSIDEQGELVVWQLTKTTRPHALIVGPTGGGKTVAILGLALAAARVGIDVRGVDPKYIELRGLRGWPGVTHLATGRSVPGMVEVIEDTAAEMHSRYDAIERGAADEDSFERILLILDEFYVFVEAVNAWWRANRPKGDRRSTHPVIDTVGQLASMSRSAGIHLLLGVQRPDSQHFPAGARDNFRFRVALSELSPEGNRMMWDREARELPRIPADLPGRAIVSTTAGPRLAQVFWTPNPAQGGLSDADRALVRALLPPGQHWDAPQRPIAAATPPEASTTITQTEPSPAERFLHLLQQALQARTAHLTAATHTGPPHPGPTSSAFGWSTDPGGHPQPGGIWLGCINGDRAYLIPTTAIEVARQVAETCGQPLRDLRSDIDEALATADLLTTETTTEGTRRTVRRTLPGVGRVRVWDLPSRSLLPAASPAHPQPAGPMARPEEKRS